MKSLSGFLFLATMFSTGFVFSSEPDKVYQCSLQGESNELFDKNIRLEVSADNRFLTFYGNDGETCNGNLDRRYRQQPGEEAITYYRFYTDCEKEDGFIQMLISENVYKAEPEGLVKMRIRGAFFHQRYYSCKGEQ